MRSSSHDSKFRKRSRPAQCDAGVRKLLTFRVSSTTRLRKAPRHSAIRMVFVLEAGSQIVAKSEFHGIANGAVQIGAVFTPPPYRGRGYARSVVAGSLDMVRRTGEKNAFLFTGEENVAAQRAYTALGFAPVGNYGIILFR
jgi:predicted GNAT family acetyltransferase